ncbi:bifunctional alpha,alpha-trehalose-phosphate synthase (UDP-forming)/trehalose-phosphatase [Pedobacter insulae]|uniref:Trehalose 6-phosphate synthase /trehalose 6-phosphatase n=1 Tax=Pedobacter insulae TaxID=414048 RepID=A0A1I2YD10_9SPHI|nr:bifunctional alpha,alpha-trehalose-phosphate synthase (UDP-forming)/trehalose-phosphatase [Pedobacter insulae]SFH23475.1 trehalose 6-phosphate synthase /trehalose 6-phosphatase [Pedobacter insulae]
MQKRLLIVSNQLPITIENQDGSYTTHQSSGGIISAVEAYLLSSGSSVFSERIWIGTPNCDRKTWEKLDTGQSNDQYLPVFAKDDQEYEKYDKGFCSSLLWPLFHYSPSLAEYDPSFFEAYQKINETFANELSGIIHPEDVIWIHDYHLLPLSGMLRAKFPNITIGLFLHIPFPSYELFRIIPKRWQKQILEGMLGADLIGFHTSEYVAHFLKTVDMSLKVEHDNQYIQWGNRQVQVDSFPMSIDFNGFNNAYTHPEVGLFRQNYLKLKSSNKMLFSVDQLDYHQGIYNQLLAYEKFLHLNPAYIGHIVFILIIVPSRDVSSKYSERKKKIDEYIGKLNSTIGSITWQPVIYHYNHLDFHELCGLYTACDIALVTPLRDGMNVVAKEFVASRKDEQGVLILSEMAGAAAELTDALLINPNDIDEITEKIAQGLAMTSDEQRLRMKNIRNIVKNYDINTWTVDFFEKLNQIKSQQLKFEVKFLDNFARQELLSDYTSSKKNLLLLDYDGTLVNFSKDPAKAAPNSELLELLRQLSESENNDIYIVSGRDSHTLEKWLGHLPIGLIAEHGAKIRDKGSKWLNQALAESTTWKTKIRKMMDHYVFRSPNTFVEEKDFSIAWHYRNADPYLAEKRSRNLHEELVEYTIQMPLDVLNGHKVIEVRNSGVNKGIAIAKLLDVAVYDFILCIGDDQTDEDMFKILANVNGAYTIKVGHQASFAKFNLSTPFLVSSLLDSMQFQTGDHLI